MDGERFLIVTADDFGIGPETSRGILELADQGSVTSSVLLVNSPFAEEAVHAWRQAGEPMELGWHPCLTLDRPVCRPDLVPSLVREDGVFWPLGSFLRRLYLNRISKTDIERELFAQYDRFCTMVRQVPRLVNSHHHVQVFPPVGDLLQSILEKQRPLPYIRRIREPRQVLFRVPAARLKRSLLTFLGSADARMQEGRGFPGNDWLAGITDPPAVADSQFLTRWLHAIPGRVVELTCHPGIHDETLIGRDCTPADGQLLRRVREYDLLQQQSFWQACKEAGFTLVSPSELIARHDHALSRAA